MQLVSPNLVEQPTTSVIANASDSLLTESGAMHRSGARHRSEESSIRRKLCLSYPNSSVSSSSTDMLSRLNATPKYDSFSPSTIRQD